MEIGPIISVGNFLRSLWSAIHSYRSGRRQSEWQERLLCLEEAEEQRRSIALQSAKLRAALGRNTTVPELLVTNEGEATAQDISITIDGIPIIELGHHPEGHFIGDNQGTLLNNWNNLD